MLFKKKPTVVGLCLGGGGARGFAHLGALKAFEEYGIKFDMVAGCSVGSCVGAFICSGMGAGFDAKEGSLKAKLNVRGSILMPKVTEELGVKYQRNESLVVAFEHERSEVEAILERGKRNGVEGLRIVERDELLAMEPNVNPDLACALLAPTGAIVCPYELCIAAVGNAMDNGAELKLNFKVASIEKKDGGYEITAENGEKVETAIVINSAGVYSEEIAKMTGDADFTVHPRRGEYMVLDKECGEFTKRTVFHTPTKMGHKQ